MGFPLNYKFLKKEICEKLTFVPDHAFFLDYVSVKPHLSEMNQVTEWFST